ncbi:sodium-dependent bicarbonate transport family permease [Bacillus pinisoli]|uniref:sodium-dependent bicarbonate transport family permease n=1 Tax=Bacillus pinisoli TaxID=2901866 RepID=UPI001FF69F33|nr:sodium-dependent bicarbonate transport family permease [Bacillus pinisoli]
MLEILTNNLFSPVVLFFVLGVIAALFKSDLKFPQALSDGLSIYLLIAIGLKGGIELSHYSLHSVFVPILGAIFLGITIPCITLVILKRLKVDFPNAIAIAATYGSISIVTYGAGISFLDQVGTSYEGFMNALVVLMESPAILLSLFLLKAAEKSKQVPAVQAHQLGIQPSLFQFVDKEVLRESIFGKSILLLTGSLLIGFFLGEEAVPKVKPLFFDLYSSILILFLLNMGLIAGARLPEVKKHGIGLLLFGLFAPLLYGTIGILTGGLIGLSIGGTMLLGVLAGSASYIAAPAALKTSVPEANPSLYLGLSLGVTFPFNLIVGIPVYYELAKWVQ